MIVNQSNICLMPISETSIDESRILFGSSSNNRSKLTRSNSTYNEDSILNEALNDLSHLNQRHVLRQQWFRRNNLVSRLRRSTSTASNSSSGSSSSSSGGSSSSGISSNSIYSSSNANTFSFASSFSTSFSANESCDNSSDYNVTDSSLASTEQYPKIIRRSSFKNKLSSGHRPYYTPRRFSLQLIKNQLINNMPDGLKFHPNKSLSSHQQLFDIRNVQPCSLMTFSYSNSNPSSSGCMLTSTKSNPSSPGRQCASNSMETQQCSLFDCGSTSQPPPITENRDNVGQTSFLLRSKSLDDLSLVSCTNTYPPDCPSENCNPSAVLAIASSNSASFACNSLTVSQAMPHHASHNAIFCSTECNHLDLSKSSMSPMYEQNLSVATGTLYSISQPSIADVVRHDDMSGPQSLQLPICAQSMSSIGPSDLQSQCDIDSVMNRINSLHVTN